MGALIGVAAAFALNSAISVENYVAAAKGAGATERQIAVAISIARAVKQTAAEKVENVVRCFGDDSAGAAICCNTRT